MGSVSVRDIVDDVDAAAAFYTGNLGFKAEMKPAPGFAMLSRGRRQADPGRRSVGNCIELFQPHSST